MDRRRNQHTSYRFAVLVRADGQFREDYLLFYVFQETDGARLCYTTHHGCVQGVL